MRSARNHVAPENSPIMGIIQQLPVTLFTDSGNAHSIRTTNNYSKKWPYARYHFVRHAVHQGIVRLGIIASEDNMAVTLTKPLGRELFEPMRQRMMSRSANSTFGTEVEDSWLIWESFGFLFKQCPRTVKLTIKSCD